MKTLKALSLATFVLMAALAFGQTSLTQTTLAADQGAGPATLFGGAQANLSTIVSLTSATGVQQAFNSSTVVTWIYVDGELEGILNTVPGSTTIFNVERAQNGTRAAYHRSGAMVLLGVMTPQFGGAAGSGGFQSVDPPIGGGCTNANIGLVPWVNVITGDQWLCSTVSNTWVPGFNNRLYPARASVTTPVASVAGTTTPSGPLFHITGTNAITAWGIPVGCNATALGSCQFTVIPDAAFTTTATNNIATAVTAVINLPIIWTWDATNSKFVSLQSK
jgi:hypothetical protein